MGLCSVTPTCPRMLASSKGPLPSTLLRGELHGFWEQGKWVLTLLWGVAKSPKHHRAHGRLEGPGLDSQTLPHPHACLCPSVSHRDVELLLSPPPEAVQRLHSQTTSASIWLCPLFAAHPQASNSTSLCLHFFLCKVKMVMLKLAATSKGHCKDASGVPADHLEGSYYRWNGHLSCSVTKQSQLS